MRVRFAQSMLALALISAPLAVGVLTACSSDVTVDGESPNKGDQNSDDESGGGDNNSESQSSSSKPSGSSGGSSTKTDGGGSGTGSGTGTGTKTDGGGGNTSGDCSKSKSKAECLQCCLKGSGGGGGGFSNFTDCICKDSCKTECADTPICGGQGSLSGACATCLQDNAQTCFKPVTDQCAQCNALQ